jgi:prepilin-type processing-associated H-X9-DG protein
VQRGLLPFIPGDPVSSILCIETANPTHLHKQRDLETFYSGTVEQGDERTRRRINAVSRKSGIAQRYSVIADFSRKKSDYTFFSKHPELDALPGLNERMQVFREEAVKLSLEAVNAIKGLEEVRNEITHIITVTCTGLFAPGLDIELSRALGLKRTVQRSSINFMGCNAALLALKQAGQICAAEPGALVLVVCTELCTLHFQKDYSDDYIMSNMLFADGSAAALIGQPRPVLSASYRPLHVSRFHSMLLHEGHDHMAWQVSEKGFIMNLSSYVSGLLNTNIKTHLEESGVSREEICHWAIHPGGKKILDDFCVALRLSREKLKSSYEVLNEFGNMSSATILFVLRHLATKGNIGSREKIYSAAFGPGLSIESAILEYV